ncbi:MAG: ATP-binding cassette domain-containing protein [Opitutales bacterium]|nr:ATP-binding cassette domain-containing protein [Opitutales bacterium]
MIRIKELTKFYQTSSGRHYVFENLSMEIPAGRNVGILGPNGAGKSTLLKILGGIDFPSSGSVEATGSMSWPLGLRGGFLPHISGRENCKTVSRIHGVHGRELAKLLDSIRDLSGIGDYFEEPVRTYSSGMSSRLGFALSMAFDFDYFLIDEITSVGDAHFKEMARTTLNEKAAKSNIIMVSHNVGDLQRFCEMAILLKDGRVSVYDSVRDAIEAYLPKDDSVDSASILLDGAPAARLEELLIPQVERQGFEELKTRFMEVFSETEMRVSSVSSAVESLSDPLVLVNAGEFFYSTMQYERALECFELASGMGVKTRECIFGTAKSADKLGQKVKQRDALLDLVAGNEADDSVFRALAKLEFERGDILKAIEYQVSVVRIRKKDHVGWYELSNYYFEAVRVKGAIRAISQAILYSDGDPFYYNRLAFYLAKANAPKLVIDSKIKELDSHDETGRRGKQFLSTLITTGEEICQKL